MPKTPPRRRPQNLHLLVRQGMARKGWTTNQLVEDLAGSVSRATVYNWISGHTQRIGSDKLAEIFAALDLTVVAEDAK